MSSEVVEGVETTRFFTIKKVKKNQMKPFLNPGNAVSSHSLTDKRRDHSRPVGQLLTMLLWALVVQMPDS